MGWDVRIFMELGEFFGEGANYGRGSDDGGGVGMREEEVSWSGV